MVEGSERLVNGWTIREAFLASICPKGARALDLGCANGEYTLPLSRIAGPMDAIDIDSGAVADVAAACEKNGGANVTAVCADLSAWARTKESGSYDFIIFSNTIQLLPRRTRGAYLAELTRLLAPGGILFIDFYTPRYIWYRLLIQSLTPLQKLKTLAYYLRRKLAGDMLTLNRFRAEVAQAGLRMDDNGSLLLPDSKWTMCRLIEGNNFGTFLGRYFEPFVLRHQQGATSSGCGGRPGFAE